MKFIGQILPIDGYVVELKGSLPHNYEKALTHLYQPLIGVNAIALYFTLLNEIELQMEGNMQTHHTLMNYLNMPLDEIYQARLKLEGIGLLNTYVWNRQEEKRYTYELKSPFSPQRFFHDAMLSQLLYHHIGKTKYDALRKWYDRDISEKQGEEITVSFGEVFSTFEPDLNNVESVSVRNEQPGPKMKKIDFSWMEQMLKQRMIPAERVLTKENRRILTQMMVLYDLTTYEIEKSVLWALNEDNLLDIAEFKEACHDLFKSKRNIPIKLTAKREPETEKEKRDKPVTKEEQLIQELETISPQQLLSDLSGGNQASEQDMKLIRDIMASQGLPAPVMNVLIHYVLLQSNMKLSKAYMEKIASHWSRANIKTAKEAMEFAKKEKNQYRKPAHNKPKYQQNKRQTSAEIIPDWFKERKKIKQKQTDEPSAVDLEKEKAEIDALLRQYSKNK